MLPVILPADAPIDNDDRFEGISPEMIDILGREYGAFEILFGMWLADSGGRDFSFSCRPGNMLRILSAVRGRGLDAQNDHARHGWARVAVKAPAQTAVPMSRSREYLIWIGMRRRCFDPRHRPYPNYGGKGVRVCLRWLSSFPEFFADVGPRPSPRHSIDRKNNDGHYSCGKCAECIANGWPANCAWATKREQQRNRRTNRVIEFRGENRTLAEWADVLNISRNILEHRLYRGWDPDRALSTPRIRKFAGRKQLSAEQKAEVAHELLKGTPNSEIAAAFGVSIWFVRGIAKKQSGGPLT